MPPSSLLHERKSPGPSFCQARPTTTNQRVKSSTTKTTTVQSVARSNETMNQSRLHSKLARLQGISARPKIANRVPTALAHSEFARSPCISRAKLVVMPHDGQGSPLRTRNVQGGKPS